MKIRKLLFVLFTAAALCGCGASGTADSTAETTAAPAESTAAAAEAESEADSFDPANRKVTEYDPDKPVIALTFDDGPNTTVTPQVLDKLEEYGAVGSFFLIGNNVNDESAEVVKRAYMMGCDIENHSMTHQNMSPLNADQISEEVDGCSKLIVDLIGEEPQFFRPPYFSTKQTMYDTIDMCFITGYGVDDWKDTVTVQERIDGVLDQACDGAIILLHDQPTNFQTVEALDTIIPSLQEQGYQLVTITQLFEAKGADPASEEYRGRVITVVE